jgi:hypothetical protein
VGWTPDDAKQPLGPLALAHDSIELVIPGKPTVLCYWDAKIKGFRQVSAVSTPGAEEPKP